MICEIKSPQKFQRVWYVPISSSVDCIDPGPTVDKELQGLHWLGARAVDARRKRYIEALGMQMYTK